jgi:hypothetical protein
VTDKTERLGDRRLRKAQGHSRINELHNTSFPYDHANVKEFVVARLRPEKITPS